MNSKQYKLYLYKYIKWFSIKRFIVLYTLHINLQFRYSAICANLFQYSKSISWEYINTNRELQVARVKNIFFKYHGNFQNLKISGWLIKSGKTS